MRGVKRLAAFTGVAFACLAAPVAVWADDFGAHKAAAEQGDAEGQYQVARDYYYSDDHKDDVLARKWFEAAAKQGHAMAAYEAAVMYSLGEGGAVDHARAMELYQQAAAGGYLRAYGDIGIIYRDGEGVPADQKEAVRWFRKGAEAGDAHSMHALGMAMINGDGTPRDVVHGVAWIERCADKNDSGCEARMAELYYNGNGVEQDYGRAFIWAGRASDHGSATGAYYVGVMTENGQGTEQDDARAFAAYDLAFQRSEHKFALIRIGVMTCQGRGTAKNVQQGLDSIVSVASTGEPEGFFAMGELYEKGICVAKDLPRAFVWRRMGITLRDGEVAPYPAELKYLSDGFTQAQRDSLETLTREVIDRVHFQYDDKSGKVAI